jgi:hypothetical protein
VGSVDGFRFYGQYEALRNSEAALIDICTYLAVDLEGRDARMSRRNGAMHHPVKVEGLKSHLASGYVARTDHVTVGAASRRRLFTPTPHLFLEYQQLEDLS